MKPIKIILAMLGTFLIPFGCSNTTEKVTTSYPQFVIEREILGAGKLTTEELKAAARKSCEVLRELGPEIQWQHSYVTGDKVYCVYTAPNKELIVKHAELVGVPANVISEVSSFITPAIAQ
jgi:hypothetical protein